MPEHAVNRLQCPVCQSPLQPLASGVACHNRHSFDRARQGYLNLLPVQHKASRAPGDNAAMVQARRDFLSAGYYRPVADFLCRAAAQGQPASWLDIGCGEGYYTDLLARSLPLACGYGLDISKDAIRQASRRNPAVNWLVGSMARIPLQAASCDLVVSLFSPLDWQEAARVLTARGQLLHLGPASGHLIELRQLIYPEVRSYDDSKHLAQLPPQFARVATEYLNFTLHLPAGQPRLDLLAMTPHGQRTTDERRERVAGQLTTVTIAIRLDRLQLTGACHAAT